MRFLQYQNYFHTDLSDCVNVFRVWSIPKNVWGSMKRQVILDSVDLRDRNGSLLELSGILSKYSVVELFEEYAEHNGLVRIKARNGDEGWIPVCALEEDI